MNAQLTDKVQSLLVDIAKHETPTIKTDNLEELYTKTHDVIRYILDNIKITEEESKDIGKYDIQNLTLYLLRTTDKIPRTSPMKEFIEKIIYEDIPDKEVCDFINFNNEIVSEFVTYRSRRSNNNTTKNILLEYGENIISRFVPISVQTDIINNLKHKRRFTVNLDTNTLNFTVYTENNKSPNNIKLLIVIVKSLYLVKLYNKTAVNIDITLFFSKIQKKFPTDSKYLGPNEINSGLTSFNFDGNAICIYREEEIEKLVLHEMVHALEIDRHIINHVNEIDSSIKCSFNINNTNKINFFECFTESIAVISNVLINSVLSGINYRTMMLNELKWSILQCSKILRFYNVYDINKFFCKDCCFPSNNQWIEKTAVLAYFFLKTAVIHDLDYFIEFFMFSTGTNIKTFYKFVMESFSDINFIDSVDIYDINYSLRMTIYDFKWS